MIDFSDAKPSVRRRVFYLPGYDPFPPRRYRELYRREGAAQAALSGYRLRLTAGQDEGAYGWNVEADIAGQRTAAVISVLVWSDIVQSSMGQGIGQTYLQLVRTARVYIGSGALQALMRLRTGPMIAALYPIVLLILELMLAGVVGALLGGLTVSVFPIAPPARVALWIIVAGAASYGILWLFRRYDRYLFAWYLMHDYAFSAALGGANPRRLEERMAVFGQKIAAALQEDVDEVLVVGHSSGAHLAISVLADLIRAGAVSGAGPVLGFLSLGQVVPMVSFLPNAGRLRGDLAYLSERPELTWVDVTAPGDGCAFALCDPVAVSGMAGPGKRWPLVLSAAFSQTLSPDRWAKVKRRYFRLHFQYMCAFDRPGDYDYFQITAGPLTLAARYAGRVPSKSRIETPCNPFGRVR